MIWLRGSILHLGLPAPWLRVSVRIPANRHLQFVLCRVKEFSGLLQAKTVEGQVVDPVDQVALLQAALLVRHAPAGDLLDVDLAAEHHTKVLLLLILCQGHSDILWFRDRRKDNPPFNNQVDRLPRVAKHLHSGGIVDALQADAVGADHPVVDHQLALCGPCLEHVRDGNAWVPVCEMWVVASTGHLVRYNRDGLGVGKRRQV